MGEIRVSCPKCGAKYDLDREYAGQEVACGECGERFVAPRAPSRSQSEKAERDLQTARIVYVLLGLFGGMIGLHDLFCGRDVCASIKVLLTVLGLFLLPVGGAFALLAVVLWVAMDLVNLLEAVPHREKRTPVGYIAVAIVCIVAGIALNLHSIRARNDKVSTDLLVERR